MKTRRVIFVMAVFSILPLLLRAQTVDLKVDSILNKNLVTGENFISVRLINLSGDSVHSIKLVRKVNDTDSVTEVWTGILKPMDTLTYLFNKVLNITKGRGYKLSVKVTPVSENEINGSNNSLSAFYYLPMAGNYFLGVGSNDYQTFAQLTGDLQKCNRADTIFINILPNSFSDILTIQVPIPVNSEKKWVIFQSVNGKRDGLTLKIREIKGSFAKFRRMSIYSYSHEPNYSEERGINLEGDNLEFSDNDFFSVNNYENRCAITLSNADSIRIENCHFRNFYTAIFYQLCLSCFRNFTENQGPHYITNCVFDSCTYGVKITADFPGLGNIKYIFRNTFNNCKYPIYQYGLYGRYFHIGFNKMNKAYIGISFTGSSEYNTIHHNFIKSDYYCIQFDGGNMAFGGRTIHHYDIYNNILIPVYIGQSYMGSKVIPFDGPAFSMDCVQDLKFFNNSVIGGYSFIDPGTNVVLKNNHFFSKYMLYLSAFTQTVPNLINFSGYSNNYYSGTDSIYGIGNTYGIKSGSSFIKDSPNEINATNEFPFFKDIYNDLHSNSYLLDNKGTYNEPVRDDIDLDPRYYPVSDIGADEYTTVNYKTDLILDSLYLSPKVCPGDQDIRFRVKNQSEEKLTAFYVNFQSNDTSGRKAFFGLNIAPGQTLGNLFLYKQHFKSGTIVPVKVWVSFPNGGIDSVNTNDTLMRTVITQHAVEIGDHVSLCKGTSVKLFDPAPFVSFYWDDKSTAPFKIAGTEKKYWVRALDSLGCITSDTVNVQIFKPFYARLGNDTSICNNRSLNLSVSNQVKSWLWSTNSPGKTITVVEPGYYSYTGFDFNNCKIVPDTIRVMVKPAYSYDRYMEFCYGDSIYIHHRYFTSSGLFIDSMKTNCGCDSLEFNYFGKLDRSGSELSISTCDYYQSPSGKYIWYKTGVYTDTLTNIWGCDSIITVHLNIPYIDKTISITDTALISNAVNVQYRWLNCSANYDFIEGETRSVFKPESSGFYAVELTSGTCVDTSGCFAYIFTGDRSLNISRETLVYPNPLKDRFTVKFNHRMDYFKIRIRNSSGMVVYTNEYFGEEQSQIFLNGPEGLYFVEIETFNAPMSVFKISKIQNGGNR